MTFDRITVDPKQMGGVPCIRGLRIPVAVIVGMHAEGMSTKLILDAFPDLFAEDIQEALEFGSGDRLDDGDEPLSSEQQERLLVAWRQAKNGEGRPAKDVLGDLGRE